MKVNEIVTNGNKMKDKIDTTFPKTTLKDNGRFSKLRYLTK